MATNKVGDFGSYNVICDRCGFKYKNHQLRKEWTGSMVCSGPGTNDCWEPRHPQDFIRVKPDSPKLQYTRPESDGEDVSPSLNCASFEYVSMTSATLQSLLQSMVNTTTPTIYDVYKLRTYGGTVTIPDGVTVRVNCTWIVGS